MESCDRCGPAVAAVETITLPSGKVLTFCGHHLRDYYKAVAEQVGGDHDALPAEVAGA